MADRSTWRSAVNEAGRQGSETGPPMARALLICGNQDFGFEGGYGVHPAIQAEKELR